MTQTTPQESDGLHDNTPARTSHSYAVVPGEPPDDIRPQVGLETAVLLTVEEAARALRIGRTKIYELLSDGTLRSVRIGRRRLVHISEVRRFASSLPHQAGNAT